MNKAEEYILAHLDESIHMDRLRREVGASARALEYAFQAAHGMGAMRYLRTISLNEVRKALLQSAAPGRRRLPRQRWIGDFGPRGIRCRV